MTDQFAQSDVILPAERIWAGSPADILRLQRIMQRRAAGASLAEIGRAEGLSKQRVHQLVKRGDAPGRTAARFLSGSGTDPAVGEPSSARGAGAVSRGDGEAL